MTMPLVITRAIEIKIGEKTVTGEIVTVIVTGTVVTEIVIDMIATIETDMTVIAVIVTVTDMTATEMSVQRGRDHPTLRNPLRKTRLVMTETAHQPTPGKW